MSLLSSFFNPPAANIGRPDLSGVAVPQGGYIPSAPGYTSFAPTGMGGAESGVLGGIENLSNFNLYPGLIPQAQGITNNLVNNPYAGNFMTGAVNAGNMGMAGANNAFGAGGNLMGLGMDIAGSAFDPQGSLYNRTLQQIQDQTRAGQAARGIQTTPYGAGLENQAVRDFNIDWQNQQLQRQIAGGQAAGNLVGQGAGLQAGAPGQYVSAAGLPYSTYGGIGRAQFGDISNLGQFGTAGASVPQNQIGDYLSYLGWAGGQQGAGNQAGLAQYYANLAGQGQGFNQAQTGWQDTTGAMNQGFQNALAQDKQAFGQQQAIWGGLGQLAGAGLNAAFMFSDERIKEDIEPVGELYDRTPVYRYRYKGDRTPRIGLLAQDVEKRRPDAVVEVDGIKAVDYRRATEWSRGIAAMSAWG